MSLPAVEPARLVSMMIDGPAGALEAILRIPALSIGAAVVAHPHPLHGGTMHTKVVHRTARFLSDRFGLAALRFNFRGVGTSAGRHDAGRGEVEDLKAAARFVRERYPEGPLLLAGFSFGSICALRASSDLAPDSLLLIGLPLDRWNDEMRGEYAGAPVWIQGEIDTFGPAPKAREFAARLGWRVSIVPGADHFFTGRLDEFEELAAERLAERLPTIGTGP